MKAVKRVGAAAICLAWLSVSTGMADARDLCLADGWDGYIVFTKAKKPKPRKAVPLNGVYYRPGSWTAPVSGTAYMTAGGTVNIGVFVHSMAPIATSNFTVTIENADAGLAGSGSYDETGNYLPDAPATWTSVDCKTLTLP